MPAKYGKLDAAAGAHVMPILFVGPPSRTDAEDARSARFRQRVLLRSWADLLGKGSRPLQERRRRDESGIPTASKRTWCSDSRNAPFPCSSRGEREEPTSYNPPARLARAHLALGALDRARADVERALERCNVPRKLRIYMLKADILLASKDRSGARGALEAALAFARDSGLSPRFDRLVQAIERRARELGAR